MELGHLLTRSGVTYLEVSSEVCHDSFCQLGNSVSLSWVVCHGAFSLHVLIIIINYYYYYYYYSVVVNNCHSHIFRVLPRFLLPIGEYCFIILGSLSRGILFTCFNNNNSNNNNNNNNNK